MVESTPTPEDRIFNHETVTFEVEGHVHRVCRYGFEKWSHSGFCDMFTLPQGDGNTEGTTLDNPIKLEGCTNTDFVSLVQVMYPDRPMRPPPLDKERWIGVLKMARKWDMPEIAGVAIKELSTIGLSPVEMVKFGLEYGVPTWLRSGYTSLVQDLKGTTFSEMSLLDPETAFRIMWAQKELADARAARMESTTYHVAQLGLSCGICYRSNGYMRLVPRGSTNCAWCHSAFHTSGYYLPGSSLPSTQPGISNPCLSEALHNVQAKVEETFERELQEAESRNTTTP